MYAIFIKHANKQVKHKIDYILKKEWQNIGFNIMIIPQYAF